MDDDIAIKVDGVYKDFKLPHEQSNSLKSFFMDIGKKSKKGYEVQHALKDISFEVKKGEFFGIVGRNGSGKSTLLKIIAEIYRPTKGKVTKSGRLVPFIELGVGFNPELTGRENVYLNGALLGFSKKEVETMYDDIVQFAELEKFMDQKLKNYSSGMQVRLAFSVATRADADILLIDEVLAVGDADFQRKCFNYFKTLKKKGTTVIFVSHDMSAIREFCDQAVLIEKSEIIGTGKAYEIAEQYNQLFLNKGESEVESADRWGDADIKTEKIKIEVRDKEVAIHQTISTKIPTTNPVVGFRVRDMSGKEVLGTNTTLENQHIGELKPNQKINLVWRIPNILSDGKYTVDPAVIHEDGITTSDWWDDAITFTIRKSKKVPYAVDPGYKLEIKHKI